MTKIIGIDLDEVLAETLDKILEDNNYILAGKEVSREDILDYYIFNNKHLNISLDEGLRLFHGVYQNDVNLNIQVALGSHKKITELKEKGYTLKIVTGRPQDMEEYSKNWINKHFTDTFESIHFANHFNYSGNKQVKRTKSEICKELGITIMVEDIFDYAWELAENEIQTFLIEKPWNKHIKTEHKNIKRVTSWEEINI